MWGCCTISHTCSVTQNNAGSVVMDALRDLNLSQEVRSRTHCEIFHVLHPGLKLSPCHKHTRDTSLCQRAEVLFSTSSHRVLSISLLLTSRGVPLMEYISECSSILSRSYLSDARHEDPLTLGCLLRVPPSVYMCTVH